MEYTVYKFCCRIVKSFPIDPDINDNLNKSSIEFLERQLYFITKTIRSYFSINQNTKSNKEQSVSIEKLTDVWLNKRKKAINIIKNNGNLPKVEQFAISIETQEQYYSSLNKYVPKDSFNNPNEERYFSHENSVVQIEALFKYGEIESLIKSTPNGESGGINGVSYEDLKGSCDDYCHVLVNIMNVMLIIADQVIGERLLCKEFRKKSHHRRPIYTT